MYKFGKYKNFYSFKSFLSIFVLSKIKQMVSELEIRIVKKASELFLMHGIRSVTMDNIATEIGISKRTLYENFADKDALLLKTLEYQKEQGKKNKEKLAKIYSNSFELSLKEYELTLQGIRAVNRNYLRDLRRYHPQVAGFFERNKKESMAEMILLTEKGQAEGYIRPELNSKILALLLRIQLEGLMTCNEIDKDFAFIDVFQTIVLNYARGIATSKGLELLEKHIG